MMRVLLADQHPDIRLALAILLGKRPGVTVVGRAGEAEGLLALVRTTQPDLIILDSRLPSMLTAELLTILRQFKQIRLMPPSTRIIRQKFCYKNFGGSLSATLLETRVV